MANLRPAPELDPASFTVKDLCRLYRIIDNLEETVNMAHQYIHHIEGHDTPVTKYVDELSEYMAEERIKIVDALRAIPPSSDEAGQERIALIVTYEAWCHEFRKETIEQFAASPLSTGAI